MVNEEWIDKNTICPMCKKAVIAEDDKQKEWFIIVDINDINKIGGYICSKCFSNKHINDIFCNTGFIPYDIFNSKGADKIREKVNYSHLP